MHSCAVAAFPFHETNCTLKGGHKIPKKRGMPTLLRGGSSASLCIHHKMLYIIAQKKLSRGGSVFLQIYVLLF